MTTLIRQNKDWLQEIVAGSVEDLLEGQRDKIAEAVMKAVLGQIFAIGCLEYGQSSSNQCGKLVIEIDLPDPDTCQDSVESVFNDGYEIMEKFYDQ